MAVSMVTRLTSGEAVLRAPGSALRPWQHVRHGGEEIVQTPGDDHVIVETDEGSNHHSSKTNACSKHGQVTEFIHKQHKKGWNPKPEKKLPLRSIHSDLKS